MYKMLRHSGIFGEFSIHIFRRRRLGEFRILCAPHYFYYYLISEGMATWGDEIIDSVVEEDPGPVDAMVASLSVSTSSARASAAGGGGGGGGGGM
jgi:hypothetical protein